MQAWNLHQLSKTYGQRPSSLLSIDDDWIAFQFDTAILSFGLEVEARYEERNKKGARKRTLKQASNDERTSVLSLFDASGKNEMLL
jgi:hypothetical protein